jgi:hypothetical protein
VEDIARLVVVVASSLPFGIVVGGESVAVLVVIAGVVESGTMRDGDGSIAGSLPFPTVVGGDGAFVLVVIGNLVESGTMRDGDGSCVVSFPLYRYDYWCWR